MTPWNWPGARNLFDLGRLPLDDGGVTASGRVWRSAAREWMTTAGWGGARGDGVRTIVDLRNTEEIGRTSEHPGVDPGVDEGFDIVHAPTEDPHDQDFLDACGRWLDHPQGWAPNVEMYPAKLAAVFTAIADSSGSVLVHCAGGRDRTGMVCAMLLQVAGVTEDANVEGYAAGWRGANGHLGHGLAYDGAGRWVSVEDEAVTDDELTAQLADRLPLARDFLRTFDTESYLRDAGLDGGRIEKLRNLLRTET